MARNTILILIFLVCALCISRSGVYAFGAGNIPSLVTLRIRPLVYSRSLSSIYHSSFAYMEGRAFRHGDIVRQRLLSFLSP